MAEPLTVGFVAVVAAMFIAQRMSGTWSGNVTHLQHVLAFSLHGLAEGQVWRAFTPNLVNGPMPGDFGPPGFGHMLYNLIGLVAFTPLVVRAYGRTRALSIVVVGGSVAYGWLVIPLGRADHFDGTSGVVYALAGAALATAVAAKSFSGHRVGVALLALYLLPGFVGQTAVTVGIHLGGFFGGVACGFAVRHVKTLRSVVAVTLVSLCAVVLLVVVRRPAIAAKDRELHPVALPLRAVVGINDPA